MECFADPAPRDYVARHATGNKCDFCGADSASVESAAIADHIRQCLKQAYEWQPGPLRSGTRRFNTAELLREKVHLELPRDSAGRLFRAISRGIGKGPWQEREQIMRLTNAWEQFREIFLRKRRFFLDAILRDYFDTSIEGFFQQIAYTAECRGLCVDIAKGASLYRARRQEPGSNFVNLANSAPLRRAGPCSRTA
jgi:hypothetical protein